MLDGHSASSYRAAERVVEVDGKISVASAALVWVLFPFFLSMASGQIWSLDLNCFGRDSEWVERMGRNHRP